MGGGGVKGCQFGLNCKDLIECSFRAAWRFWNSSNDNYYVHVEHPSSSFLWICMHGRLMLPDRFTRDLLIRQSAVP